MAEWAVKGKTFRPSDSAVAVTVFETLLCISGAISLQWNGLNSLWDYILFPLALTAALGIGWKALRLATRRVNVQGEWLTFSELFRTKRLNLKTVTEVCPMLHSSLISKRAVMEGVILFGGSEQIRLTRELQGFHMLMLYLAQRLPETWGEILKAMAIGEMRIEGDQLKVFAVDVTKRPQDERLQE